MMGWDGVGGFGLGGILSLIFMAGFWILIVVGIVLVVRALTGPRHDGHASPASAAPPHGPLTPPIVPTEGGGSPTRSEALRILEERYAHGDIEREDFLQRKADLLA